MKNPTFTVKTSDLAAALSVASVAVGNKASLPILSHALFSNKAGTLTISATNLDINISAECEANGSDWSGCVPLKRLKDSTLYMADDAVFTVDAKLSIKSGSVEFELFTLPAVDFPPRPECKGERVLFDRADLLEALSKTVSTCSVDRDDRYTLKGVHFYKDGLESTDGRRLHRATMKECVSGEFILPAPACETLRKLLSECESDVICNYDADRAEFALGTSSISCNLINGKFPNVNQAIPSESKFEFAVTPDLKKCIQSVIGYRGENSFSTQLDISNKSLSAKSSGAIGVGKSVIAIEGKGKPCRIAIDASKFIDALDACSQLPATVYLIDEFSPLVVKNENTLCVVMLMHS